MVFDYYYFKIKKIKTKKTEKMYGHIIYVLDFIYFLLCFN